MKYLVASLIFLLSFNSYSQEEIPQKKIFLRVYNLKGKKIGSGKVISISDSILKLKRHNQINYVHYNEIGFIRSKRSFGNSVLIGSSIGFTTGYILVATGGDGGGTFDGYNGIGIGLTTTIGSLIGVLTGASKNIKKFEINGNKENFKEFKGAILGKK